MNWIGTLVFLFCSYCISFADYGTMNFVCIARDAGADAGFSGEWVPLLFLSGFFSPKKLIGIKVILMLTKPQGNHREKSWN